MVVVVSADTIWPDHSVVGLGGSTGYTKRKAMEKWTSAKKDRIDKHKGTMGMRPRKP